MKKPSISLSGRDPVFQLYRAVIRYVAFNGGDVGFLGGIELQQWDMNKPETFIIGVRCTGIKPTFARTIRQARKSERR